MTTQDDALRDLAKSVAPLLDIISQPSSEPAAAKATESAAESLKDIAAAVSQERAIQPPTLPPSMQGNQVVQAIVEKSPPHIQRQMQKIAAAEAAATNASGTIPKPPRRRSRRSSAAPLPPPMPPPTQAQVRSATGRARRQRYAAGRAARGRDKRRQRLMDRMANRTSGGRLATVGRAARDLIRNPSSAAQQLPRMASALGASSATAARLAAVAGPVGLAIGAAIATQQAVNRVGHTALNMGSAAMDPASKQVLGGMLDIATGSPLTMLPQLIKAIPEWTNALLESKRGISMFSAALSQYFTEAQYRDIQRGLASGRSTGASTAFLGGQYQDFLDSVQPMKDDVHTILSMLMSVGLEALKPLVHLAYIASNISGVYSIAQWWRSKFKQDVSYTPFKEMALKGLKPMASRRVPR